MHEITMNDLLAPETKRDPSAFAAHLHGQGPILSLTGFGEDGRSWLVTHYDDVIAVLKDPRFTKDPQKLSPLSQEALSPADEKAALIKSLFTYRRDMLVRDPPDHTRLRGLVSKAFTPRMIEQLRPRIRQITDELLDKVQEHGQMDLIADFAYPLPITVISDMLGIPVADREQFRVWSRGIVTGTTGPDPEKTLVAMEAFVQYIQTLLEKKRTYPGTDLISAMIEVKENEDRLSQTEIISTIFLLIVAGHETTANLIGNGTLALLQNTEQMHRLRTDLSLIPAAIEELLRYTVPVSLSTQRWASEDITLHNQVIRKGEVVFVSLTGANNDPHQFSDPEVLNIARQENPHLAFGKGIHFCLGAPLARLEGQIALSTLLQRLPRLRLACNPEQLTWVHNPLHRGLTSLPVAF